MLEIKNLHAKIADEDAEILKGIDLTAGSVWSIKCVKSAGRCIVKRQ